MVDREADVGSILTGIRGRAEDIRNRINDLHLNFERNQFLNWNEVLEQFVVLSGQFSRLNEELKPILNNFVISPADVIPQDPNRIPELLRTKTHPEIESEELKMLENYEATVAGMDEKTRIAELSDKLQQYNSALERTEEVYEELKEQFNLKVGGKSTELAAKAGTQQSVNEANQASLKQIWNAISNGAGLRSAIPNKPEEGNPLATSPTILKPLSSQPNAEVQPVSSLHPLGMNVGVSLGHPVKQAAVSRGPLGTQIMQKLSQVHPYLPSTGVAVNATNTGFNVGMAPMSNPIGMNPMMGVPNAANQMNRSINPSPSIGIHPGMRQFAGGRGQPAFNLSIGTGTPVLMNNAQPGAMGTGPSSQMFFAPQVKPMMFMASNVQNPSAPRVPQQPKPQINTLPMQNQPRQ